LNSALQTLGVKLVSYLAGAVVSVFMARALGPHERGVWSIALLAAGVLAVVSDGGLSNSVLYVIRNRPDRSRASVRMSFGLVLAGFSFWTVVALALGSRGWLPVRSLSLALVPVIASGALCIASTTLARQLLAGNADIAGANLSVLAQALLLPPTLWIAVRALTATAAIALAAYASVLAATLLVTVWRLRRRELAGPGWDASLTPTLVTYGLQSQMATLALILAYRSDLFLVDHALGASAAGIYSVALTLSEVLRGVPETAQILVLSRARNNDLVGQAARVARQAVLATTVGGLAMMAGSFVLVPLVFGEPYRGATTAFACLVPGVIGLALSYSVSPLLSLEGRINVSALGAMAALATLWLAGLYGPGGIGLPKIATASSLAYWVLAGVQVGELHRTARLSVGTLVPGKADLASVVDAALALAKGWAKSLHGPADAPPPGVRG
jgi:O-antigen/teichoic acid export membrane protein